MTDLSHFAMASESFETGRFGERLRELIADIGEPVAAQLTGKSARQLKRYVAGDEPPFGVLRSLTEASGATLEWVTYGRSLSRKDHVLSMRLNERAVRQLKNQIKATDDIDKLVKLKELVRINQQLLDLSDQAVRTHDRAARDGIELWSGDKRTGLELIVRLSGDAVDASYRNLGRRLAPRDVTTETARFVGMLMDDLKGSLDPAKIEAAVRRVATRFDDQLRRDAAEPGSGKREAS